MQHSLVLRATLLAVGLVVSTPVDVSDSIEQGFKNVHKQISGLPSLEHVDLEKLPDNSLFTRWRPVAHFEAPNSWMNDPCAPLYDGADDTYHLYYQVTPDVLHDGFAAWGHAKSKDMIFWEDVTDYKNDKYVAIQRNKTNPFADVAIFTGGGLAVSVDGKKNNGTILAIYTSVNHMPIQWTRPYQAQSETQSMSISTDGGQTFQQYGNGPVIPHPPKDINVTGWRDPKFEQSRALDLAIHGKDLGNYYLTLSSGDRGSDTTWEGAQHSTYKGPRLLLYTAKPDNLAKWDYLGPLIKVPTNFTVNNVWSGSGGANFEVSNAFSLPEGDTLHHFAAVGIEGGHGNTSESAWYQANIEIQEDGSPQYDIIAGGLSDHGDGYAINGFFDPVKNRRIFYAWVKEIITYGGRAIGYNGQLSLPREVYVQVHDNVLASRTPFINTKGPWLFKPKKGHPTVGKLTTLGIRPISEVSALRAGSKYLQTKSTISASSSKSDLKIIDSTNFEFNSSFVIPVGTKAGIQFRADQNDREFTTLMYDPATQTLTLDRRHSSLMPQFIETPGAKPIYHAKHYLVDYVGKSAEPLELRVFVDNSLVEVYANSRTVLSTHVYPALLASTQLRFMVDGPGNVAVRGSVWSGLKNAWPGRPANSSTQLN